MTRPAVICFTMSEPLPEFAATAARMQIIGAVEVVESSVCRSLAPGCS